MRILYINHYAGSPEYGMEYRPYYLAREWVRQGHEVAMVAASNSHVRSRQPDVAGTFSEQTIDGVRYIWCATPPYRGNGVRRVANIFTFIYRLYQLAPRLIKEFRPDAVIASSTYPLDIYPASKIAAVANARLIFEVHDLWPLTLIELAGMSRRHPFIALLQRAENAAYRCADKVVSMLPAAEPHMLQHGMAAEKFIYIPNGIALDEWADQDASLVPKELREHILQAQSEGKLVITYAGGHGVSNELGTLLDAVEQASRLAASWVLVGNGPEKSALEERARQRGLDNIRFFAPIPKRAIPGLLQMSDALYLGWRRSPLYRFGISPNKIFDYLMAGKPIVHAVDAANDPVKDAQAGFSVQPEAPEAIVGAVKELLQLSEAERQAMGRRGKDYVTRFHTFDHLAERFVTHALQ